MKKVIVGVMMLVMMMNMANAGNPDMDIVDNALRNIDFLTSDLSQEDDSDRLREIVSEIADWRAIIADEMDQ